MHINNDIKPKSTTIYNVNDNGDIQLSSIKDKAILSFAKECDKDKNDLLQNNEIRCFIQKYGLNEQDCDTEVYYKQYNKDGVIMKRSLLGKDNMAITYFYKKGRPVYCNATQKDGSKYTMNFETKEAVYYSDGNDSKTARKFKLDAENYAIFHGLGLVNEDNSFFSKIINFFTK